MIGGPRAWRWTEGFLGLLFPPQCVWCQLPVAPSQRFCLHCQRRFASDYYRCQKCAAPLPSVLPNADCVRCRDRRWRFEAVYTLAPYRGDMRRAVIMIKRKRYEPLRRGLAELLGDRLMGCFSASRPPTLVPVPYHWSHGFSTAADTAELIAWGIAAQTSWPVAPRAVRRVRKTAKQGVLTWAQRRGNVRRAFAIRRPSDIRGRHVIIVDDVFTSGATAAELARVLLRGGAAAVSVAVIARATGVRDSTGVE